jgi:serine/threonine protein kinase
MTPLRLEALLPSPTAFDSPGPPLDPAYLNLVRQSLRTPARGTPPPARTGSAEATGPPRSLLGAAEGGLPWTSLERFQIRRELGRGGFGVVFLAYDPLLGREVALKVPRADVLVTPELRERFRREAYAASNLEHPNLVPVYEAGEEGAVCFLIEAYCPGPTLADWLKQRTEPVLFRDAAELMAALADAIQHAHRRGVLHRDLKPANVLLQIADGRVQIESQVGRSDVPSAISICSLSFPGSLILASPSFSAAPPSARRTAELSWARPATSRRSKPQGGAGSTAAQLISIAWERSFTSC